jgi:SAM-dependent methyltransferase
MTSSTPRLVNDELDLLAECAPLADARIIELGCGAAALSRKLLARYPMAQVVGLEVDERQHAKNLAAPAERLSFVQAGAQAIPYPDASFDLAIMLKSLHHVPLDLIDRALAEAARVLKPGGLLYVSEPVFAGDFNEIVRLFNDEQHVRAEAQAALRRAEASPPWAAAGEIRFEMPRRFADFADFARKTIDVTFAERRLDEATLREVRARFERHLTPEGASFLTPMRVNLLRRSPV